jgi:hypothetical protein
LWLGNGWWKREVFIEGEQNILVVCTFFKKRHQIYLGLRKVKTDLAGIISSG